MRTCLVSMPWQALDFPSLPLGILARTVRDARPGDDVRTLHANIRFVEAMHEWSSGEITPDDYMDVVEHGLFHGLGDWVFTSALYAGATWPEERFAAYRETEPVDDGPARAMRALVPEFVERLAGELLATEPDVVGLSSTFMQNVPS